MHSRPLLPVAERILPYLKRIDESRYYSNSGPLVLELEKRLSEHFGCGVVTTSSCTSGLMACLMASGLPKGSMVAVPSWTFVATASSIVAAGCAPYFYDTTENVILSMSSGIKFEFILPVFPFGAPVGVKQYLEKLFGVPVVFDAAAGFDTVRKNYSPVSVISTHATKVFSTGEGGLVLSKDELFLKAVREICNFGINAERGVNYLGLNGKMSEYSAAVGLAELDRWHEKRERWLDVKRRYALAFSEYRSLVEGEWASNVYPIVLDRPSAPVASKMREKGFLCREWVPVHRFKAYENFPRTEMTVTDKLAETTMLLPFSVDTTDKEIESLQEALCASL